MKFTKEQREDFVKCSGPLIQFMKKNCHPYAVVLVDDEHAELMEGIVSSKWKTKDGVHHTTYYDCADCLVI